MFRRLLCLILPHRYAVAYGPDDEPLGLLCRRCAKFLTLAECEAINRAALERVRRELRRLFPDRFD